MTRRCDGNIGARQAKVSRHIFPEEAARISIGPARRRDLNRIHWRRASEWQHKRAANLPNLLHQRGTRGLLLNSGHQRNWWKKKKKKERKRKKERKKEKRRRERRGGYFHRDEKPPAIPLSRFSREETRIVSKSRNVLPLFRVRRTRKWLWREKLSFEDEKERTCFFCKSNRLGLNFTTILFSFQQLDSAITIPSIFHSCLNGALGFFFQILQHFERSYSATNYTHFINNFQMH